MRNAEIQSNNNKIETSFQRGHYKGLRNYKMPIKTTFLQMKQLQNKLHKNDSNKSDLTDISFRGGMISRSKIQSRQQLRRNRNNSSNNTNAGFEYEENKMLLIENNSSGEKENKQIRYNTVIKKNREKIKLKANPEALCQQMLENVLKIPQRNRPNQGMIKRLMIQKKQINNLFSNQISFKRADYIEKQMMRQFGSQNYNQMRNSVNTSLEKNLQEMNLSNYQTDQNISLALWEVPNLNQDPSLEEIQMSPAKSDFEDSLLEITKMEIKHKPICHTQLTGQNNNHLNTMSNGFHIRQNGHDIASRKPKSQMQKYRDQSNDIMSIADQPERNQEKTILAICSDQQQYHTSLEDHHANVAEQLKKKRIQTVMNVTAVPGATFYTQTNIESSEILISPHKQKSQNESIISSQRKSIRLVGDSQQPKGFTNQIGTNNNNNNQASTQSIINPYQIQVILGGSRPQSRQIVDRSKKNTVFTQALHQSGNIMNRTMNIPSQQSNQAVDSQINNSYNHQNRRLRNSSGLNHQPNDSKDQFNNSFNLPIQNTNNLINGSNTNNISNFNESANTSQISIKNLLRPKTVTTRIQHSSYVKQDIMTRLKNYYKNQ